MEARSRGSVTRAVTASPEPRPGALSSFVKIFGPYILGGLVLWAASIGLTYLVFPGDIGMAVIFGSLLPLVGYRAWQTIGWWRGGLLPDDPDARRWTTATVWSDVSRSGTGDDDDVRRAVCTETIFGSLLVLGPFAMFALEDQVDEAVLFGAIAAAFAVAGALWLSVALWGRPRWLLPAEYRHPDRYSAARRAVTAKNQMQPKRKQAR